MILFRSDMAEKILAGQKTVTRRKPRGMKKRWNVGAVHQARINLFGKPFAELRILKVEYECFPGLAVVPPLPRSVLRAWQREAKREGFKTWRLFGKAFRKMHGRNAMREPCWRIEFEVVKHRPEA